MAGDDLAVDVSHDWLQACFVQERFMRSGPRSDCQADYGASCRQIRALGGDCYEFTCLDDGQEAMLVGCLRKVSCCRPYDGKCAGIAAARGTVYRRAALRYFRKPRRLLEPGSVAFSQGKSHLSGSLGPAPIPKML